MIFRQLKNDWLNKSYSWFLLKLCLLIPAVVLFLAVALVLSVRIGIFGYIPSTDELSQIKNPIASEIYDMADELIGKYYDENRTDVSYAEFPQHLIHALISTEDARFYHHRGIDWIAYPRVFIKTLLLGDRSGGGGSTITQQLVKNLFDRSDGSWIQIPVFKVKEMLTARRLESIYSKEDILEFYMNTVPFGHNYYGLEVAAQRYFKKAASELNIQESATLVGMLKANSYYNPVEHPDRCTERRNTVFMLMQSNGFLNQMEFDSLSSLPLTLRYNEESWNKGRATYFRSMLKGEVQQILKEHAQSEYNLYTDGLKIYTTLNGSLQEYAENALKSHISELQQSFDLHWKDRDVWMNENNFLLVLKSTERYQKYERAGLDHTDIMNEMAKIRQMTIYTPSGPASRNMSPIDSVAYYLRQLHAGYLGIDTTGAIKAWVGGTDIQFFPYDHVRSKRQMGSIIKPWIYYSAYHRNFEPCQFMQNHLVSYVDYDDWTPRNADGKYEGWYSLRGALTHSINTVSASLILNNGIKETIQDIEGLGFSDPLPYLPSIALGAAESSLENILPVYAALLRARPAPQLWCVRKISDKDGNVIYENKTISNQSTTPIDPVAAKQVLNDMRNVVNSGTASRLRWKYHIKSDIAGKTGTTQNGSDGWFIACSPNYISGAWVGGEYPFIRFRTSNYAQGAHLALPIVAKVYDELQRTSKFKGITNSKFFIPDTIMADCPLYLSDSAYLVSPWNMDVSSRNSESTDIIQSILDLLSGSGEGNHKNNSSTQSDKSKKIQEKNERIKEKRARKKKRKDFFDKLFN